MDSDDISKILLALAAFLGPVLVYFNAKRAQKDANRQAVGAARVTETTEQLNTWKEIAERHEKDRNDAREQQRLAEGREDEERAKRRKAEARVDELMDERHELLAEYSAIRGAVVGQVALSAQVFDRLSPESAEALEEDQPRTLGPVVEESGP